MASTYPHIRSDASHPSEYKVPANPQTSLFFNHHLHRLLISFSFSQHIFLPFSLSLPFEMPPAAVTETMPNLSNTFIDGGRYELLDVLGSGAYGKVYRARDTASPKHKPVFYAIKCLARPKPGSRQDDFQRREFKLHKMVAEHPNIVTFHRTITTDAHTFVVLDLCTGGDLFTAITENRVYSGKDDLIKIAFLQLIDAVELCHQQGVFHRDIKPENILCSQDGSYLLLADFGLSTMNRISRDFGCGSSYYMSPECIGKEVSVEMYSTRHSDVWSLGVILVNMITGRNPWRYASSKDECFQAYMRDDDFLRQVLPISDGANEIIKGIFDINPLRRITLAELRDAIMGVDTFFMSQYELAHAPSCVRDAAKGYGMRVPPAALDDRIAKFEERRVERAEVPNGAGSDEAYIYSGPEYDAVNPPNAPADPIVDHIQALIDVLDVSTTQQCSTSEPASSRSGGASEGPITPDTPAVDPEVRISDDMELAAAEADVAAADISLPRKQPDRTTETAGHPKHSHIFQRAVQRFKGISSGSFAF
ncbi:hypothetical protein HGRIS_009500 [Hohenbuehelia grisea]|uniref:non-specific serine/threonine protein kinase n=1 Tax=Hohenbuehelia grisea TaxID=104357 RepID=A0ABR3J1C3_9AGAR